VTTALLTQQVALVAEQLGVHVQWIAFWNTTHSKLRLMTSDLSTLAMRGLENCRIDRDLKVYDFSHAPDKAAAGTSAQAASKPGRRITDNNPTNPNGPTSFVAVISFRWRNSASWLSGGRFLILETERRLAA
jgi:hypothetical protein